MAKAAGNVENFKYILTQVEASYSSYIYEDPLPPVEYTKIRPEFKSARWGQDVIVDSVNTCQGVSIDATKDSIIYIASSYQNSSSDTFCINVYSSSDAGDSWQWFATIGGQGYAYHLCNPCLQTVHADDTSYIFVAFDGEPVNNPSEGYIGIWCFNLISWSDTTYFVSNISEVKEFGPDLASDDVQYPYAPYLYCTWVSSDSVVFARSVNKGKNWSERVVLKNGNMILDYRVPKCSYGWYDPAMDSMTIGVCWEYYHTLAEITRIYYANNTTYGHSFSWNSPVMFNVPTGNNDYLPDIELLHQGSATVVMNNRYDTPSQQYSLVFRYTYDGENWQEGILDSNSAVAFFPSLAVDDSCGKFHVCYSSYTNAKYTGTPYDSLPPQYWSIPVRINNSSINDTVCISTGLFENQPMASWVRHTASNECVMFDAIWNLTGMCDLHDWNMHRMAIFPNPCPDQLQMILPSSYTGADVSVYLYDISGRMVRQWQRQSASTSMAFDLTGIPPGIYFIGLDAPEWMHPVKVVVTQ